MRAALAAHDEVLRAAIEAHGGWLFKHTGDGVCAVFTSPKAAVEAAVAAQQALELPVRMGISTGEAELRGSDYFGAVLNRAARVMAAGHGGQILLDGLDGGSAARGRPGRPGAAAAAGHHRPGAGVPGPRPGPAHRVPAAGHPGSDVGEPAGPDHQPDRARVGSRRGGSGAEGPSGGDADRCRAGWARPAWRWRSPPGWPMSFPTGSGFSSWPRSTDPAAVPDAVAAVLGITQQPGKTVTESVAAALEGRVAVAGVRQLRTRAATPPPI